MGFCIWSRIRNTLFSNEAIYILYVFCCFCYLINAGAIALFKRICSQINISYYEVEEIFLEQNRDFFKSTKLLSKRYGYTDDGEVFIKLFNTLIVPKPTDVEKLLNKIRKLSPEDQAEALLLIANKKIKIIVEDI